MRAATVKAGLKMLIAAVSLLIIASFYHDPLSRALSLSTTASGQFVYLSFFWGGMLGGGGILVIIIGLLRTSVAGQRVRLAPTLLTLLALVVFFFMLLYRSFTVPSDSPTLRPGETIVI
jgi:hypothetical protein